MIFLDFRQQLFLLIIRQMRNTLCVAGPTQLQIRVEPVPLTKWIVPPCPICMSCTAIRLIFNPTMAGKQVAIPT